MKKENFPFELSVIERNSVARTEPSYNIRIINKHNGEIQVIEEGTLPANAKFDDLIKLHDVNNDGHIDILALSVYPSLQWVHTLYLFDDREGRFVSKMDDIPYEGTITPLSPGCIKVEYIVRTGSEYLPPQSFCWNNGKWQLK